MRRACEPEQPFLCCNVPIPHYVTRHKVIPGTSTRDFIMRTALCCLTVVCVFAASALGADKVTWEEVANAKFGMKGQFPGKPKLVEKDTGGTYSLVLPGATYMMQYVTLGTPVDVKNDKAVKEHFDYLESGIVKGFQRGAKLLSSKDLKGTKYPTRDVEIQMTDGDLCIARFVTDGKKGCQMAVIGEPAIARGKMGTRFRNSLELD